MTVKIEDLSEFSDTKIIGYRLINSKFPPIHLFDDVASSEEFEDLYAIQSLTNPRIQNEVGALNLLPLSEIPFGIPGCHYAAACFTHVNPDGSRFSNGSYGLMYIADTSETALAEVRHHQSIYWSHVPQLHYERFVFRELICSFSVTNGVDATSIPMDNPIYSPNEYSYSRLLGGEIKRAASHTALKYSSVRNGGSVCFALFTPKEVISVVQAKHYEMIWDQSKISSVNIIS
ncbi:MAG: RES family NAD+ phosphorylase [Pseudomonadota bacterium]